MEISSLPSHVSDETGYQYNRSGMAYRARCGFQSYWIYPPARSGVVTDFFRRIINIFDS